METKEGMYLLAALARVERLRCYGIMLRVMIEKFVLISLLGKNIVKRNDHEVSFLIFYEYFK